MVLKDNELVDLFWSEFWGFLFYVLKGVAFYEVKGEKWLCLVFFYTFKPTNVFILCLLFHIYNIMSFETTPLRDLVYLRMSNIGK